MNRTENPYPRFLTDEASGVEVADIRHLIWAEGYLAAMKAKPTIKSVIKTPDDSVIVLDERGEQIPPYQGRYEEVKPDIMKDAPSTAIFSHVIDGQTELTIVPREQW